jgi:apolipoprotein N-acyltransferase
VEPPKDPARRDHPLVQGARYGGIGCVGCLTFFVLGIVVLAALASGRGAIAGLLILAVAGLGVYALVKRPRR